MIYVKLVTYETYSSFINNCILCPRNTKNLFSGNDFRKAAQINTPQVIEKH